MAQINLLPWREQARQVKKMNFAISLVSCIVGAIFCLLILHVYYQSVVSNQNQRNTYLQTELAKEHAELDRLNQQKEQQTKDEMDLKFLLSLQNSGYQTVKLLDALSRSVPETVTLEKVMRNGNEVIIFGKAKSNLQITTLMKNIEKTPIFKQPELTEIAGKNNSPGENRLFRLKVQLEE